MTTSKLPVIQERFCQYYVELEKAGEKNPGPKAAIRANYSAKDAISRAEKLLIRKDINDRINEIKNHNENDDELTKWIFEKLKLNIDICLSRVPDFHNPAEANESIRILVDNIEKFRGCEDICL